MDLEELGYTDELAKKFGYTVEDLIWDDTNVATLEGIDFEPEALAKIRGLWWREDIRKSDYYVTPNTSEQSKLFHHLRRFFIKRWRN